MGNKGNNYNKRYKDKTDIDMSELNFQEAVLYDFEKQKRREKRKNNKSKKRKSKREIFLEDDD